MFGLMLLGCNAKTSQQKTPEFTIEYAQISIPNQEIQKSLLTYDKQTSLWEYKGELYSGYATSFYKYDIIKDKIGFVNGRKQGKALKWFLDGELKEVAHYHKGKLHGEKKVWSSEEHHNLLSHLQYYSGQPHGEQKQWYQTGEIYKVLHLNMGKEEGLQQAFRRNGDLYANYEAKNGRIFGLKKAALCYGLKEEKINYKK